MTAAAVSRAVISAGPKSQPKKVLPWRVSGACIERPTRASNKACRAPFTICAASLLALPSTPKPTDTPALSMRRMVAMPVALWISKVWGSCHFIQ